VGDHDGGHAEAALEGADLLAQAGADAGVERGERLVEQEEAGGGGQRAGEGHALLLAAGELDGVFRALLGQADEGEQLGDAGGDLGPAAAAVDEAVGDVVEDAEVGKERVGLEDDAEVALGGRRVADVAAVDLDRALVLGVEAGDGAQERGLAAARGAEEADELAAGDVEVDGAQGLEAAEALAEAADAQEGGGLGGHASPKRGVAAGGGGHATA
jgi:hypothetical protein